MVKGQGQGHQGQKRCALPLPPGATEWNALAAHNVISSRRDHSVAAGRDFGGLHAVYIW